MVLKKTVLVLDDSITKSPAIARENALAITYTVSLAVLTFKVIQGR